MAKKYAGDLDPLSYTTKRAHPSNRCGCPSVKGSPAKSRTHTEKGWTPKAGVTPRPFK